MHQGKYSSNKPTAAYIGVTWISLGIGTLGYLLGLWNSTLQLNEKGFYLAVFLFAMFAAVTLQKTVRDRVEGIPVTNVFVGMCWASFAASIALLVIGLINAEMALSEKGFYGISFVLSLFAIITVQKNIRDTVNHTGESDQPAFPEADNGPDMMLEATEVIEE